MLAEQDGRDNARTLFGLVRIPCDNHVRQLLDGAPRESFDGQLHATAEDLGVRGALVPVRRLGGRLLVTLEGTQFFHSPTLRCADCTRRLRGGRVKHYHRMLDAGIVALGVAHARPPEFVPPRGLVPEPEGERQEVDQ